MITHRIEMQTKERELLESYVTAYQVKSISSPFVEILKDATALIAVSGIILLILNKKLEDLGLPADWPETTAGMNREQLEDWLETQNLVGMGIGGLLGLFLGGIIGSAAGPVGTVGGGVAGAAAGVAAGNYTVEQLEDLKVEAEKAAHQASVLSLMLAATAIREGKEAVETAQAIAGTGLDYINPFN